MEQQSLLHGQSPNYPANPQLDNLPPDTYQPPPQHYQQPPVNYQQPSPQHYQQQPIYHPPPQYSNINVNQTSAQSVVVIGRRNNYCCLFCVFLFLGIIIFPLIWLFWPLALICLCFAMCG